MGRIFLRYATREDAEFLFHLANDSECRKNSLNSSEITFENHIKWLEEILDSQTEKQYVLIDGLEPVGQGRLSLVEESCRISYSIIPERRGCGYGKILIQLLNNAMFQDFPQCMYSYGEVLKRNVSSQKIFEELGYAVEEQEERYCYRKQVERYSVGQMDIEPSGGYYS